MMRVVLVMTTATAILSLLYLYDSGSLHSSLSQPVVSPDTQETDAEKLKRIIRWPFHQVKDIDKLKRTLHGSVHQKLEDGHLPLEAAGSTWSLWKSDPPESSCGGYFVRFGRGLAQVPLVSFPCSGNTWIRYLLEAATGVFTGSIYVSEGIFKSGMLGEKANSSDGRTLVQKTHSLSFIKDFSHLKQRRHSPTLSKPAVLLVRNPAKAIISLWKYKKSGSQTEQIPYDQFETDEFHQYVAQKISVWEIVAMDRLMLSKAAVFLVYYEHLKEEPIATLQSLLAFLGVPEDEGRLTCTLTHLKGNFKREGSKEIDPYTPKEKELMANATERVNITLQLLGYPPLPHYSLLH